MKLEGVCFRRIPMNQQDSKTNRDLAFFNARIDELQFNSYERIRAKAQLARTEAVADAIVAIARGVHRLLKTLVFRPLRR